MCQENISAAQEAVVKKPPDLDLSEVESNNSSDEESYDRSSVSVSSNDEVFSGKEEEMSLSEEFVKKIYDEVRLSASEVASYVNDGNIDLEHKYDKATAMYWASEHGFDETVHQLVSSGALVKTTSSSGRSPLQAASVSGHFSVVKILLQHGANVNHQNDRGFTALMLASNNGHFSVAEMLLQHGANVNHQNNDGYTATALMYASNRNHESIVSLLLQNNADTTMVKKNGKTAFDLADDGSNTKILLGIFSNKVDVGSEESKQVFLSALDRKDVEIVEKMLSIGFVYSDVNIKEMFDDDQVKERISSLASSGNYVGVATLLYFGFKIADDLESDHDLMMMMKIFNSSPSIDQVSSDKSQIDVEDDFLKTLFSSLVKSGSLLLVHKMLDAGFSSVADPKDEDWLTLYFSASKQGNSPLVKKLISLGFDVNIKNATGQTAMDLAKNDETALVLLNSTKCVIVNSWEKFFWSKAEKKDFEWIYKLLEKGFDEVVNKDNEDWLNLYFSASKQGDIPLVKKLISLGFDVNGQDEKDKNKTPLQIASQNGREALVSELLEIGASLDLKNAVGLTAMDLAKNEEIEKILFNFTQSVNVNSWEKFFWSKAEKKDFEWLGNLLNKGFSKAFDKDNKDWKELFWSAAKEKTMPSFSVVLKLLNAGFSSLVDPNLSDWDRLFWSAVNSEAYDVVTKLIEAGFGSKVSKDNEDYKKLYFQASVLGHVNLVTTMLELKVGFVVDFTDQKQRTALQLAAENGHEDLVEELLKRKADLNVKSDMDFKAVQYAMKNQHQRIISLLLNADFPDRRLRTILERHQDIKNYVEDPKNYVEDTKIFKS